MNVLIVDDAAPSLGLLRAVLEDAGFAVREADDGVTALDLLQREPVDAIITDLLMPRMDGYRLCFEVRRNEKLKHLPILIHTHAYTSEHDEQTAFRLGADAFLLKSAPAQTIIETLRDAIRRAPHRASRPLSSTRDVDLVHEHNDRLIGKLTEKNRELEAQTKTLQASEARLRAMIETEPECVKVISGDGRLLEMNPAGLAMLEAASLADAQQCPLMNFIAPEFHAAFAQLHRQVMAGQSGILEFEIIGLQGTRRRMETHAAPLRDAAGRVESLLAVTRDVTARRLSESALRQSESVNRAILESALDCIVAIDQEGNIIEFNPAAEKTFGYRRVEALGQEMATLLIPPALRDRHRQGMARVLGGGASQIMGRRLELTAMRKGGGEFPAELTIAPTSTAGAPKFTGFIRDITERKAAEKELAAERNLLRTLIDNLPGYIYVKDTAGRYLIINRANARLLGVTTPSEIIGKTVFDFFRLETARAFEAEDHAVIQSGQPVVDREERYSVNGKSGWFSTTKVPLRDAEGGLIGLVGITTDITDRKLTESHKTALSNLGQKLSATKTAREAGGVIVEAADQLFGWDCCTLDMYSAKTGQVWRVLNMDLVDGCRTDCPPASPGAELTARARHAVEHGSSLVLREPPFAMPSDSVPFGDTSRPSVSIMTVPIRDGSEVIGILSIQSYRQRAYTHQDLEVLQGMADHCASALTRISSNEALRRAEEQYRSIFENVQEGILRTDPAGRIVAANPALARMLGYATPDEFIARVPFASSGLYTSALARQKLLDLVNRQGLARNFETEFQRRDGSNIWVSLNPRAIRNATGELVYIDGSIQDITERKRAEDDLRATEVRFRQLAENINEVFWMTDPAKQIMLYISPAYEKIWGRTCESLYQSPGSWADAIHPDDRPGVLEAAMTRQTQGTYDEIYRINRPDGTSRWIHDRAFPIRNEQGEVYRIVGTAEDITRQRNLESQLRQSQKMEAIGTLAGGIAHDFNNILGAINGFTELARLDAEDNPALQDCLNEISRAGSRATDLVRQILTFSRHHEQPRKPLNLRPVVSEALTLLRATVPSTIQFNLALAPDAPIVLADATQVHQIVMNLGTNAHHAMLERPGHLDVTLAGQDVDQDMAAANPSLQPGRYAVLSIKDTGRGMERGVLERIFEPFFTTKAPGQGTGLGLSVVHGIMRSHDGAISVASQPGQGTTIHLYFPAAKTTTIATDKGESATPAGSGENILLVDDEEALVKLGRRMLERLGYKVLALTSPVDALEHLRAAPQAFDLVITDLTMPGMTGVKLAREILRLRPGLPIILTTGYAANLTLDEIHAIGIRELVMKPLSRQSLGEAIHRVLHPGSPS